MRATEARRSRPRTALPDALTKTGRRMVGKGPDRCLCPRHDAHRQGEVSKGLVPLAVVVFFTTSADSIASNVLPGESISSHLTHVLRSSLPNKCHLYFGHSAFCFDAFSRRWNHIIIRQAHDPPSDEPDRKYDSRYEKTRCDVHHLILLIRRAESSRRDCMSTMVTCCVPARLDSSSASSAARAFRVCDSLTCSAMAR